MKELHLHIRRSGLHDLHINVFEVAAVEIDLSNLDVADVLENIWNDLLEASVDTIL